MAGRIHARGKWKRVKIDPNLFVQKEFEDLVCFEELTDYDLVYGDELKQDDQVQERKVKRKKGQKPQSQDEDLVVENYKKDEEDEKMESDLPVVNKKVEKKKKVKKNEKIQSDLPAVVEKVKKKKKVKKSGQCSATFSSSNAEPEETADSKPDMSSWNGLPIPAPVLKCLSELNFSAPTPIQALTLPPAINDRLDIVGAAETGSGKTLAFSIPLIHHILQERESEHNSPNNDGTSNVEPDEDHVDEMSVDGDNTAEPEGKYKKSILHALIITPTRELAIQIRNHIQAITKYTDIKCCAVVGGMSVQKQTRLLRRCPEIVIGTPGRLWELIQQGNSHLSKLEDVRYLVIDEADRMVEKGHFQELTNILQVINSPSHPSSHCRRQTFVFSATLTFVPVKPQRLEFAKKKKKKSIHQFTMKEKLESLMGLIGITTKVRIIDLTRKQGTTSGLVEMRIACTVEEKDLYLYYILHRYPGRTLVFANSKDCVRRLMSVFALLKCSPLALHADMHQRQRLKNLDRFKASSQSVLIATDVAARGLDIPNVQHVVHYQVPRTTENYVHRSGRTARAMKEGLSVMLVSPEDLPNYRKIVKTLNRDEELASFPIDSDCLSVFKPIVTLAGRVDKDEHSLSKVKARNRWFQQAAEELDIELDDQLDDDSEDIQQRATLQRKLQAQKRHLDQLLAQPIAKNNFSGKYPTKSGKLITPVIDDCATTPSDILKSTKVSRKRKSKGKSPAVPS